MLARIPRRGFVPTRSGLAASPTSSTLFRGFASTSSQSLDDREFRIGIIGGGPAGFYAASRLLSLPGSSRVNVDLFELLPTPFGLARFGVAPDHPEVKVRESL